MGGYRRTCSLLILWSGPAKQFFLHFQTYTTRLSVSTRCKGKARYKLAWENCLRQSEVLLLGGAAPHINALQLFSLKPFFPKWAYLWKLNVMQSKFISMWALLDTDNKNIVPSTLQEPNITSVLRKSGLMTSHKAENCEKDQVTRKIHVFRYSPPLVATDNNHHFLLFQTHWLEFVFLTWWTIVLD